VCSVDWGALNRIARDALETLGITHIDPRERLARLSLGDRNAGQDIERLPRRCGGAGTPLCHGRAHRGN